MNLRGNLNGNKVNWAMGRLEDGSMKIWLTIVNWTLTDKSIGRKGKKKNISEEASATSLCCCVAVVFDCA